MKNPRILLVTAIAFAIVLIANSASPPDGHTGAPGDGLCSDCHGGSNPLGLDGEIEISGPGPNVLAGETYQLSVLVTNPNGIAQKAGFQIVALDENDGNVGTLSNPSANATLSTSGGRTYFKHNPSVDFPASNEVEWTVDWTAPTGMTSSFVTFYGAGNIADGNGLNTQDFIVTDELDADIEQPTQPLEIEIVSSTDVSCFGESNGSAEAEATGGTGSGYTFLWSNGESGPVAVQLDAGSHSATVTDDGGSTAETSVTITEPDLVEIHLIDLTNNACEGGAEGAITVEASGGVSPFNYAWSDGSAGPASSGLPAGDYFLTVTDNNGCTETAAYTILDGNPIDVVPLVENVSCYEGDDGEIELVVSGDEPPFSIAWSTGDTGSELTGLSAGFYSATITDNANCETITEVEVSEPAPLEVIVLTTDVSCHNGTDGEIELVVSGDNPPFEAVWSDGFEGLENTMLEADTYHFTLTDDNGCETQESAQVNEPDELQIDLTAIPSTCPDCDDGTISASVTGGVDDYSFTWDTDPVQTESTAENLLPGLYSVTVSDGNDCSAIASFNLEAEGHCDSTIAYFYNQTDILCDTGVLTGYCFFMGPADGDSIAWPGCDGQFFLNPQWITFVAGSDSLGFSLEIQDCEQGDGVQIGVYELPPDLEFGPDQTGLLPDSSWLVGGCSLVESPQIGELNFGVETYPGKTYGLVFNGYNGDRCNVELLQVEGALPATDLAQEQLSPPVFDKSGIEGGMGDTICQGALGVTFALDQGVEGASFYLWTLDGQELENGENDLERIVDFPDPGTFEICVIAANSCSSTDSACVDVHVSPLPTHVWLDTICQREFYFWDSPFGPVGDTLGPFDTAGDFEFVDTLTSATGCILVAELFLHVIEDNFDNPTELLEVICWDNPDPVYVPFEGHPQAQSFDMTGVFGEDRELFITLESSPGMEFECDSFFILELLVLETIIEPLNFTCTDSELIIYPGSSPMLPGLEDYEEDIVIHYQWMRSADSSIVSSGVYSDSADLVLSVPLELLSEDLENFALHLESRYSEDPDSTVCLNIFTIDIFSGDLTSIELAIQGPDTLTIDESYTFVGEDLTGFAGDFSWSFDPQPEVVEFDADSMSVNLVYSVAGAAEICFTGSNMCGITDTACIEVVIDTDVTAPYQVAGNLNLEVFPNPFEEIIQVHSEKEIGNADWKIYDSSARLVLSGSDQYDKNIVINAASLSSGIYFLQIVVGDNMRSFQVVKN